MNPNTDRSYLRVKKITILIAVLILAAGLLGWYLGRSDDKPANNNQTNSTQQTNQPVVADNNSDTAVKSLVSYKLPFNWGEASCPAEAGSVFVMPSGGSEAYCDVPNPSFNPVSPVKISVDSGNNKDCNQLQNVQNVSKHICISEYINGKKSLKAETVYNSSSSYKRDTAVNAYYIDTGKGVVLLEYFHSPNDNEYQAGFEELAKSVQVKG